MNGLFGCSSSQSRRLDEIESHVWVRRSAAPGGHCRWVGDNQNRFGMSLGRGAVWRQYLCLGRAVVIVLSVVRRNQDRWIIRTSLHLCNCQSNS